MEYVQEIEPADLAALLASKSRKNLLLIYAKSQKLGMSDDKIKNSILMSVIVRRKRINLDKYISLDQQKEIMDKVINKIVIYNYDTPFLARLTENLDIQLILKTISDKFKDCNTSLLFLKGGLLYFSNEYPHLCDISKIENKPVILEPLSSPQEKKPKVEPCMLLPWLYLGEMEHAQNFSLLAKFQFTHLLNVASDQTSRSSKDINSNLSVHPPSGDCSLNLVSRFEAYWESNFAYRHLHIIDDKLEDIIQYFMPSFDFIDECKMRQGRCLVYCQAGISRSPTICVAYLMERLGQDFWLALGAVKRKRRVVNPNMNFLFQLDTFNKDCIERRLSRISVQTLDPDSPKSTSPSRRYSDINLEPNFFIFPDSENKEEILGNGNKVGKIHLEREIIINENIDGEPIEKCLNTMEENNGEKCRNDTRKICDKQNKSKFIYNNLETNVTPVKFEKWIIPEPLENIQILSFDSINKNLPLTDCLKDGDLKRINHNKKIPDIGVFETYELNSKGIDSTEKIGTEPKPNFQNVEDCILNNKERFIFNMVDAPTFDYDKNHIVDTPEKFGSNKKEKSTDCDSALIPLLCVHG